MTLWVLDSPPKKHAGSKTMVYIPPIFFNKIRPFGHHGLNLHPKKKFRLSLGRWRLRWVWRWTIPSYRTSTSMRCSARSLAVPNFWSLKVDELGSFGCDECKPGVSKGCFLEVFKCSRVSKKHSFVTPGTCFYKKTCGFHPKTGR